MIADIAGIFHWPLADIEALPFDELSFWHVQAVDFFNRTQSAKG